MKGPSRMVLYAGIPIAVVLGLSVQLARVARRLNGVETQLRRHLAEHRREEMEKRELISKREREERELARQKPYFPDLAFSSEQPEHDFSAGWYTRQLQAMREPSLWKLSQSNPPETIFRLIWVPTFHASMAVRITKSGSRRTLHAVALTGQGGYAPGKIDGTRDRELTPAEWDSIESLIEKIDFWAMPTTTKRPPGTLVLDGDRRIFEGIKDTKYHVTDPDEPTSDYDLLCLRMLELSGLEFRRAWSQYQPSR